LVVEGRNHLREFFPFGLTVKPGTPWNFDQVLIVGCAVHFNLRGQQFLSYGLHLISSGQAGMGDRMNADRTG
jgi:hypothetical protein